MPSEVNSSVLSGFLDYLKIEKGLARLTISAYTTDIGQFAGFLEKRKRRSLKPAAKMCANSFSSFSQPGGWSQRGA